MENRRCVINVMQNNTTRISIRMMDNFFVVNKKIRFRENGDVTYRQEVPVDEILPADITFQVKSNGAFITRVRCFGRQFRNQ